MLVLPTEKSREVKECTILNPLSQTKRGIAEYPDSLMPERSEGKTLPQKMKTTFVTSWEWMKWILTICPEDDDHMETLEEISERPTELGEEFGKKPLANLTDLILATLNDPSKVKTYRKDGQKEISYFVTSFKKHVTSKNTLFTGVNRGISSAIFEALSFVNGNSKIFKKELLPFILKNNAIIAMAFKNHCANVVSQLGGHRSETIDAIKIIFDKYLPEVADKALANPKKCESFLNDLYKMSSFDPEDLQKILRKHLHVGMSKEVKKAMTKLFEDDCQVLIEMRNPQCLHEDLAGTQLDLMGFYKTLAAELTQTQLADLSNLFKTSFPLLSTVFSQLKEVRSKSESQYKRLCNNIPKAIPVLRLLYGDFKNPPSPPSTRTTQA